MLTLRCERAEGSPSVSYRSAQRAERGADFVGEELRLLPRREVTTFVEPVVMDEVWDMPPRSSFGEPYKFRRETR